MDKTTLICNDQSNVEKYAALFLNNDATRGQITATNVTFDIKGDSDKASNGAENGVITIDGLIAGVKVKVASISYGDTSYTFDTIEDAIRYAKEGETITLLAPVVVNAGETRTLNKAVTITHNSNVPGEDMFTNRGTMVVDGATLVYTNTDTTASNVTVSTISC